MASGGNNFNDFSENRLIKTAHLQSLQFATRKITSRQLFPVSILLPPVSGVTNVVGWVGLPEQECQVRSVSCLLTKPLKETGTTDRQAGSCMEAQQNY